MDLRYIEIESTELYTIGFKAKLLQFLSEPVVFTTKLFLIPAALVVSTPPSAPISISEWCSYGHEYARNQKTAGKRKEEGYDSLKN
ncbi:MAG: hypothetical protein ABIP00_02025 [Pyrinomonadaceae bacterium]